MRKIQSLMQRWTGHLVLIACTFLFLGSIAAWVYIDRGKPNFTSVRSDPHGALPDPQGTGGPPIAVAIAFGILLFGSAYWFLRVYTPRGVARPDVQPVEYKLGVWIFLLENGKLYDGLISGLASEDLSRLTSRRLAAERLAAALAPWDIRDGFAASHAKSRYPNRLAKEAKRLTDDLAATVAESGTEPGDWCLIVFTFTDSANARIPADLSPAHLAQALRIAVAGYPGNDSVMFIRHRTLSEASGRRAVAALRDRVLVSTRTK